MSKFVLAILTWLVMVGTPVAQAQEQGDPQSGAMFAREVCASCHAVEKGNMRSPVAEAPSFSTIAAVPGMTAAALRSSLNSSHRSMPNLILPPDEARNIVAYILSLN